MEVVVMVEVAAAALVIVTIVGSLVTSHGIVRIKANLLGIATESVGAVGLVAGEVVAAGPALIAGRLVTSLANARSLDETTMSATIATKLATFHGIVRINDNQSFNHLFFHKRGCKFFMFYVSKLFCFLYYCFCEFFVFSSSF